MDSVTTNKGITNQGKNFIRKRQLQLMYKVSWRDYCLMLYFLSLCGNNFFSTYIPTIIYPITALGLVVYYYLNEKTRKIGSNAIKCIMIIVGSYVTLFVLQFLVFRWNTVPGIINHISKFIVGAGFIVYFGKRFRFVFFKTMFYLSIVSLPLWVLQNIFDGLPGVPWALGNTIWIYNYREGEDIVRNCGFFWEPGAMGGYIVFFFLLFLSDLGQLFARFKFECIIILIALLSTQSTGAYVSFSVLLLCYFMFSMKSRIRYLMMPIFVIIAILGFTKLDFLEEKIVRQNEDAEFQEVGDFSSTRVGTLMFDIYYIAKHPIIGNGLHERTRLADHKEIADALNEGDLAAMGNGFTDTLAKWGLMYFLVFGYVFWCRNKRMSITQKICFFFVLIVILQGECFLNYPLFLGIPLIQIIPMEKKKKRRNEGSMAIDDVRTI